MAGSRQAAEKMKQTMIERHGSEEAWRAWMRENASKGGKNSKSGGFAHPNADPRAAGSKGGKISKRRPKQ